MTKEQLINILENDPRCKLGGKSAVITFYESPFDDVVITEDSVAITIDSETIELGQDDITEKVDPAFLQFGLVNKKIWVKIFFGEENLEIIPFDEESSATISTYAFEPFPIIDDGGEGGGLA